jgi:hypothetical protein
MGGRARQTQQTTSTTQLPGNQQQNVDKLQQAAGDLFASGGPSYFPGQTYANPTTNETAGRTAATGYATGAGQDFVNHYQSGEATWLDPKNIFNPSNIPGFQAAQQGVTDNVNQNLTRNILPAIRGNSAGTGGLGGSRSAIAEGIAGGDASKSLAQTLAGMNMNAYSQGLSQYNNAAARAPTTFGLGLAPSDVQQTVGAADRTDLQKAIDENVSRFNFDQLRPLLNAQTLQSLTGTAGQYGGTTNSTSQQSVNGGSGVLQGIGGLLSLASLMYGGIGKQPNMASSTVAAAG